MKKILVLAALLLASTASAQTIGGTAHDLGRAANAGIYGTGDTCAYCHVAHNARTTAPLWGRADGAALTAYTSSTVTVVLAANIDGITRACMSCHDGVTNPGVTLNNNFGGTATVIAGSVIGQDLGNDHPVSMNWDATKAGLGVDTTAAAAAGFVFYGGAGGTQITCATCHSVHNNVNTRFLRVSVTGGPFCSTCHSRK